MLKTLIFLSILFFHLPSFAYVLSAPPRESEEAGLKLYGPFAQHLTKVLGSQVTYKHPGNWLQYQRSIKRDEYDIVFDGPHLTSWRIKHHGHTALMMLPGNLVFYFITRTENDLINGPRDLAAQKVCVLPPPNLNSLVLLEHLDSIHKEPVVKGIKGGNKAVIARLLKDECVAAVVPEGFFLKKLKPKVAKQLKVIYKSSPLANQAITAGSRIPKKSVGRLLDSISSGKGLGIINSFGKRFGSDFVPANNKKYHDASSLLEGAILGWHGKGKNKKNYLTE